MPRELLQEPETPTNHPVSDSKKRRMVLRDTVEKFSQNNASELYEKRARQNHQAWSDSKTALPGRVNVIAGDWGDVTLALAKSTGIIYAVLNMANAQVPGGLYLEGFPAQEENMYRRTNCHFYLRDEEMVADKSEYNQELSDLINGVDGRVYLDVENPRICIKGPELIDATGYEDLPMSDYFLFYELKSAADSLANTSEFNETSMRRKIAAQLDTLKSQNIRHVVLSAFGCGVFSNPAHEVAVIYREELQKRTGDFDDVTFAIYNSGHGPNNFEPFRKALHGLPLSIEQAHKLTELVSALKNDLNSKKWEQNQSKFLFFTVSKVPAEIIQIRELLNSDMNELSKIKKLREIAVNNLEGSTLAISLNPIQAFYRSILKVELGSIDSNIIDLFRAADKTPYQP